MRPHADSRAPAPRIRPLRGAAAFARVLDRGARVSDQALALRALPRGGDEAAREVRLGVMTGRRFGKAVQRNLVRRRLRESVRALRQQLGEAWDLVLIPRPAARALTYDQLRGSVSCLLRRAGVIASDG